MTISTTELGIEDARSILGNKNIRIKIWILNYLSKQKDVTASYANILDAIVDAKMRVSVTPNELSSILCGRMKAYITEVGTESRKGITGSHYNVKLYKLDKEWKGVKWNAKRL